MNTIMNNIARNANVYNNDNTGIVLQYGIAAASCFKDYYIAIKEKAGLIYQIDGNHLDDILDKVKFDRSVVHGSIDDVHQLFTSEAGWTYEDVLVKVNNIITWDRVENTLEIDFSIQFPFGARELKVTVREVDPWRTMPEKPTGLVTKAEWLEYQKKVEEFEKRSTLRSSLNMELLKKVTPDEVNKRYYTVKPLYASCVEDAHNNIVYADGLQ